MENKKDKIIELFFIEHLTVKDIAKAVDTSSSYITKIIKKDDTYMQEKEYRKSISKDKRKIAQNEFMRNKK